MSSVIWQQQQAALEAAAAFVLFPFSLSFFLFRTLFRNISVWFVFKCLFAPKRVEIFRMYGLLSVPDFNWIASQYFVVFSFEFDSIHRLFQLSFIVSREKNVFHYPHSHPSVSFSLRVCINAVNKVSAIKFSNIPCEAYCIYIFDEIVCMSGCVVHQCAIREILKVHKIYLWNDIDTCIRVCRCRI